MSLEEKEVLLKEIHHRVKNNLQIITSLLSLQSGKISDEYLLNEFKDCESRVKSMALIHEKLYRSSDLSRIDIGAYVESLTKYLIHSFNIDLTRINLELVVDPIFLNVDKAVPCGLIINELVSNSLKYAFPGESKGTILIKLERKDDNQLSLIVSDNGIGMSNNFDIKNMNSLGLQLVETLTRQLGASLDIQNNNGLVVKIVFNDSEKTGIGGSVCQEQKC